MKAIAFEAYHYAGSGPGPRRCSDRQDIQFTRVGDSITVSLPPPAACVLYLTIPPEEFVKAMQHLSEARAR